MVAVLMDRRLAQIICGVLGVLLFILFFSDHPAANNIYLKIVNDYWQIVFAFTLVVGVVGFFRINLKGIVRGEDTVFRVAGLVALIVMPVFALIWGVKAGTPFMWMFQNVQVPMQSTVFALLAFFVASASLRGFRARSAQAGILLIAALIALIARSDIGDVVWTQLPVFSDWIRANPSMAARRAILIGIGLGSLTTSLRVIIGIERTWLGRER
jgi:hypothetical protein